MERQKECDSAETKDLEEMDQEPRAGLADLVRRGYLGGVLKSLDPLNGSLFFPGGSSQVLC